MVSFRSIRSSWPRKDDYKLSPVNQRAVQSLDGLLRACLRSEAHEKKRSKLKRDSYRASNVDRGIARVTRSVRACGCLRRSV